eukprot:2534244-Pleurochrysis_carterae.AAC.1
MPCSPRHAYSPRHALLVAPRPARLVAPCSSRLRPAHRATPAARRVPLCCGLLEGVFVCCLRARQS